MYIPTKRMLARTFPPPNPSDLKYLFQPDDIYTEANFGVPFFSGLADLEISN